MCNYLVVGEALVVRMELLGEQLGFSANRVGNLIEVEESDGFPELPQIVDLFSVSVDAGVFAQSHAKGNLLEFGSDFMLHRRRALAWSWRNRIQGLMR